MQDPQEVCNTVPESHRMEEWQHRLLSGKAGDVG